MKHYIWIDILKGLAIVLVVAGHTYNSMPLLLKIIYSFHMPLFFFISGFVFNFEKYENNIILLIKNLAYKLLIPYILSVILICFMFGFSYNPKVFLWFLPVLLCTKLLLWLFLKIQKALKIKDVFCLLISFAMALIATKLGKYHFREVSYDIVIVCLYFSYFGYVFNKQNLYKIFFEKSPKLLILLSIAAFIWILDISFFGISLFDRVYTNPIVSFNGALCACILFTYFAIQLSNLTCFTFLRKPLVYFGFNTLCVYIFHIYIVSANENITFILRLIFSAIVIEFFALNLFQAKSVTTMFKNK